MKVMADTIVLMVIMMGIFALLLALTYVEDEKPVVASILGAIGVFAMVLGIVGGLAIMPAGNYTEWKIDSIIEISPVEDEQYVIDTGNEYIFKASLPFEIDDGEQYIIIEKDGDTTIDFEKIGKGETSKCVTFSRNEKSVLGATLKKTYTKYVFYIPAA